LPKKKRKEKEKEKEKERARIIKFSLRKDQLARD